jgi:ABC-type nitrate/sulfonate/bicarbonate transport system substrate-binding protein/ribosomal protein S27E
MSLAESPLTSVTDFPDKTIAIPTGLQAQIAPSGGRRRLDPESVTFVPVGTDPGMLAAGQVDGYYGWATNQGVMLMTRGVDINIAYMNDLGIPGYAGVITATDETIAERGDVLIRWLRAEIKGWQWHLENPEEMAELMVSTYGQRGLDLEAQTVESRLMADFVPIGDAAENGLLWLDPAVFQQGIDFEVATGGIEEGAVTRRGCRHAGPDRRGAQHRMTCPSCGHILARDAAGHWQAAPGRLSVADGVIADVTEGDAGPTP